MPNHIQNRLRFTGTPEAIKELTDHIKSVSIDEDNGQPYERDIDFNKIIPMPEELNITADGWASQIEGTKSFSRPRPISEVRAEMLEKIKDYEEKHREATIENFTKAAANVAKYGYATWYNWSVDMWGTKWNAYRTKTEDGEIWFQTAWSAPRGLIRKLSEMFPRVTIELTCASEDSGYHVGVFKYEGGVIVSQYTPEGGSTAAYEIYFEMHPERKEDYKLIDGKYEYVEE